MRVIDPTTSLSHEIRHSSAYPVKIQWYAAGVSMGDGSVLVCGGYNPDTRSTTAECNYVDSTTLAVSASLRHCQSLSGTTRLTRFPTVSRFHCLKRFQVHLPTNGNVTVDYLT